MLKFITSHLQKEKTPYRTDKFGNIIHFQLPNWKYKIIAMCNFGLNSSSVARVFTDKNYTSQILKHNWFKVPEEILLLKNFHNPDQIKSTTTEFAKNHWFPLVRKPLNLNRWKWIIKISNQTELNKQIQKFTKEKFWYEKIILQQFITGQIVRVLYLNWEIIFSHQKQWLREKNFDWQKEYKTTKKDTIFSQKIATIFWANYFGLDCIIQNENQAIHESTILEINGSPWLNFLQNFPNKKKHIEQKILKAIYYDYTFGT